MIKLKKVYQNIIQRPLDLAWIMCQKSCKLYVHLYCNLADKSIIKCWLKSCLIHASILLNLYCFEDVSDGVQIWMFWSINRL